MRFIFLAECSFSAPRKTIQFLESTTRKMSFFHIIANKKATYIFWQWVFKFMLILWSAMKSVENEIFWGVEFVEVFSILCYPSLSRIGKTSLCFPTHKCPGSTPLLNSHCVENLTFWSVSNFILAAAIFVHKYKWKYGLWCQYSFVSSAKNLRE